MSSTYTYSLASDFSGNLKEFQFHQEITNESGITPTLSGINLSDDVVDIVFDSVLSVGEQTTLDNLVAAHVPDNSPARVIFFNLSPKQESTRSTSYQKLGRFNYQGSDEIGPINYIDVISYKESSVVTYAVRVYDKTNNNVIAEATDLTNTESDVIDLGTISNIPIKQAVFEIQAKRSGGTGSTRDVFVEQVVVYHNN